MVAPRASPTFCHSSTVSFPVFRRLFSSWGDQPSLRASSELEIPQYPSAISTICLVVMVSPPCGYSKLFRIKSQIYFLKNNLKS
nr:MAG TPA: hypothetical protein [Caudoviricetes sp.]